MLSDSPQVLIVGAGPSGLVLALTLLKNGIPVRIVEKAPVHYSGIFRGSGISPRTQEVEHFLGVLDEVKEFAKGPPTVNMYDENDPRIIAKSIEFMQDYEPTPPFPITRYAILGQSKHQEILRKHIEALGGNVELSTELASLSQDEDAVTATFTRTAGNIKIEEFAKFAYVIGTDGGRSTVRKSLGIEFLGESKDFSVLLADIETEGFDGTGIHRWGEAKKNVVSLNSHGEPNMYQLLCGGPWFDVQAVMTDDSIERLQQEFTKCVKRPDIKITKVISKGVWRPNTRMATHFRAGRVFLAGDAAHIHPPMGGQGLNTSIMDSYNLGWKLALVIRRLSPPSFLNTYEAERMPVIAEMLKISTLLNAAHHQDKTLQEAFIKAQVQGLIAKDAKADEIWMRGWKLTQLDLNYRHSPIVLDERFEAKKSAIIDAYGTEGHSIRAGDRAPEAPNLRVRIGLATQIQTTRLFELFTPSAHTALIFPEASEKETQPFVNSVLQTLKGLPSGLIRAVLVLPKSHSGTFHPMIGVDIIVRDDEGHAYTNYGLSYDTATVVLVRPDAYIGGILKGPNGVRKYFSMVFNNLI